MLIDGIKKCIPSTLSLNDVSGLYLLMLMLEINDSERRKKKKKREEDELIVTNVLLIKSHT